MREKYGFEIDIEDVLGVYDVIDAAQGDHWISTTYICTYRSGEPRILVPGKCSEIGWFILPEIEKMPLSRISKINLCDIKNLISTR